MIDHTGEVNHQSRTVISKQYFEQMATAKIIVTSNPSHWEGDFRLCEAMASGALIFVDEMYVPRPFPFQDHQHLIYYNNMNKTDLFAKLDAIRSNPERLQEIALRGFAHALTFHRAVNLIDYIFCSVHIKERALQEKVYNLLNDNGEVIMDKKRWKYSYHGYLMRYIALQRQQGRNQQQIENILKSAEAR